jgi:hypothetical protein
MMVTYEEIVAGAAASWVVTLRSFDVWPDGADGWSWSLRLSAPDDRSELAASFAAASASKGSSGKVLTLVVEASAEETADLEAGTYFVECVAIDDSRDPRAYPAVHGSVVVRAMEGGLPDAGS